MAATKPQDDHEEDQPPTTIREKLTQVNVVQQTLLILALAYTLYFVRPVLLPIILALILALILKPIHKSMCKMKIPSALASVSIILSTLGIICLGVYYLSIPAIEYSDKLADNTVKKRLQAVFQPITKIQSEISDVADQVDNITADVPPIDKDLVDGADGKSEDGDTKKDTKKINPETLAKKKGKAFAEGMVATKPISVNVSKNPVDELYKVVKSIGYHIVITLTLLYFLLAYGESMLRRMTEVENTANLLEEVANEVSHYMFTITAINLALGIVVGITMYAFGMPNPILWGVLAAVLNFIPFIGAIIGTAVVFLVAATHYDENVYIALVPACYYLATLIEGNFVTPAILGRHFTINPIVIFVWVMCWGALWGIPGMLIGLPLLMTCRIILSRWGQFSRLERIISA